VYEDCRRDADVRLGPALAASLGPALSLILDAARWLTAEAADVYLVALNDIYDRLARRTGPVVPFASYWFNVHHLMFQEDETPLVELLTGRLRERWASVLPVPPGERRVRFDVEEVRPRADLAFGGRRRGWRSALYHSPDLMLAGPSAEAVSEGRFEYVLGEVHASTNTLRPWLWVSQHPSSDDLLRAAERDQPEPLVIPVASRGPGGVTLRMSRGLSSPKDYRLMIAADTCDVPAGRALPAGALEVERVGGRLEVRTRNGSMRFDLLDVMGDLVSLQVLHTFEILPRSDYTPRVNIGPLVVARETWRFPCASLGFAEMQNERDRYLAARRWRRAHDMPRFVFIRTRHGEKPVFVDFDSLLSIDVLARAVRRPAPKGSAEERTATIVEMLPTPDQMWLTDAEGRRYASELRMVAVDRDPWEG
jgi:hypothetical protein